MYLEYLFGRNNQIAWGATAYKVDDQDLYVEQFSEEFPDKYKTKDGWDLVDTKIEEIPCRDVLGFNKDVFRYKVQVTSHGPILLSSGNSAVSLKWIGENQKLPSFEAYYKMARAKDWEEFRNALKDYDGTAQTFLFADRKAMSVYKLPERFHRG
ncbi:MAG: penicillin acylase family protein [Cyanobacteriota/Melainabacteria group bacterium]